MAESVGGGCITTCQYCKFYTTGCAVIFVARDFDVYTMSRHNAKLLGIAGGCPATYCSVLFITQYYRTTFAIPVLQRYFRNKSCSYHSLVLVGFAKIYEECSSGIYNSIPWYDPKASDSNRPERLRYVIYTECGAMHRSGAAFLTILTIYQNHSYLASHAHVTVWTGP